MPAPANVSELLDLIQKSGVVEDAKLKAYVRKLTDGGTMPADPAKLAGVLVRDAILTYFQAEQILQGKYKRFSIGKYKVLEKLGAGGMAQVFLCEHKLMRRRVAIKVLPTAKAEDRASLDRFYREARVIAAVDHPNLVRAYDIDQDENLHFLVMEYVDGSNLQELVKKAGPLDVTRACHYIYGSAVGLQHAHEIGLVHRDIKPGNILIDRTGVVKILDLGLARFFHDEEDALTKKYDENVLGTADYLAPEQALDSHSVDIRADIYSLGATFYYLLTGSALFPEGSVAQKLIWHQNRQPRPLRSLRPEVPEELDAVVERMKAKDPAKRYQTPAEVIAALAPWVATPIPPPTDREMPQVSPAAGGGRGPGSMVGVPGMPVNSDSPTVVAVQATPTYPLPAIHPSSGTITQPTAQPEVWESLDGDTQPVAKGDTDRSAAQSGKSSRTYRQLKKPGGKLPLILAGVCLLVLAGGAAGVFFTFFNKPKGQTVPPTSVGPKRIVVSASSADGAEPNLRAALTKAASGDTIVIADARVQEPPLRLDPRKHKDLTIESGHPDGRSVIELSGKAGMLLDAPSVEGFHLKNIGFDGKGAATGIQISGICPGVVLENVWFEGATVGVKFLNAAGGADRPIVLDRVRTFKLLGPDSAGISIEASNVDTRWVTVQNCRFEGPCKAGIRVKGGTSDLIIAGNRFFDLDAALMFGKPDKDVSVKAQIASNTVVKANSGVEFELAKAPEKPDQPKPPAAAFSPLVIQQNYFGQTSVVCKVVGANPPVAGKIEWKDNAMGPGSNPGVGAGLHQLTAAPVPGSNPVEDAAFLRFPGGRPSVGGQPVGAP